MSNCSLEDGSQVSSLLRENVQVFCSGLQQDTRMEIIDLLSKFTDSQISIEKLIDGFCKSIDPLMSQVLVKLILDLELGKTFMARYCSPLIQHAAACRFVDEVWSKSANAKASHAKDLWSKGVNAKASHDQLATCLARKPSSHIAKKSSKDDDDDDYTDSDFEMPNSSHMMKHYKEIYKKQRKLGNMWLKEESLELTRLVVSQEMHSWQQIAQILNEKFHRNKTSSMCHQHYKRVSDPSIKQSEWTREEDEKLLYAYQIYKQRWSQIALLIPGRPDTQCRRRWAKIQKRYKAIG